MDTAMKIKQYILDHKEQIVADTIMLVEHQSGTLDIEYVERCADAIEQLFMQRLGVAPEQVFRPEGRGRHLFYRIGTGRPKALMIGHYDTVWQVDALPVVLDGNRLAGPGVYDMKYGIVSGIWALKALLAVCGDLGGSFGFFMNSDEELGSRTSAPYLKTLAPQFENVLVLEPTVSGAVKTGRKGIGNFEIQIQGIASHAGTDYTKGRSAILEAARLTEKLFGMTDLEAGSTVNVGQISGGTKPNVIAAEACLKVDIRVLTMAEAERITAEITSLQPTQDGVTLKITGGLNRPPMEPTEAGKALFHKAVEAAAAFGEKLQGITVGGGSDGNFTSAWGIATLDGLGGDGDGGHAVTEHLLIDESLYSTARLAELIRIL